MLKSTLLRLHCFYASSSLLVLQVTMKLEIDFQSFVFLLERYTLAPSLVKLCLKMPTSDEYLPINSKRSSRGGEAKRPSKVA